MKKFYHLYPYRFTLFLISLLFVLFGTLFIPSKLFVTYVIPLFFIINILAGILLISKKNRIKNLFVVVLFVAIVLYVLSSILAIDEILLTYTNFAILFSFYSIVTYVIITQVWRSKRVNRGVILGLMSGYICLGLVGFFICMAVEIIEPDSFSGLISQELNSEGNRDDLIYFSFITLLTIGYGDILPLTQLARNASVIIGLLGQFYLVIVTAVVVEKYIRHSDRLE
ncbi:potassium channel family protein [uncultured Eudoraea sp.]|uniref:potassium channel family protein n=1 Tax=uncultured Eudoraea sp. TaxID=1035614 RepID=UPI00262E3B72|nr:potassium channel family protein [uncultured Eudoraea sp.]